MLNFTILSIGDVFLYIYIYILFNLNRTCGHNIIQIRNMFYGVIIFHWIFPNILHIQFECGEYFVTYFKSNKTFLWIWILLWNKFVIVLFLLIKWRHVIYIYKRMHSHHREPLETLENPVSIFLQYKCSFILMYLHSVNKTTVYTETSRFLEKRW